MNNGPRTVTGWCHINCEPPHLFKRCISNRNGQIEAFLSRAEERLLWGGGGGGGGQVSPTNGDNPNSKCTSNQ